MKLDSIKIRHSDGSITEYHLERSRTAVNLFEIKLSRDNRLIIQKQSTDFFSALIELRKELEPLGLELLCWGARRDVWPRAIQLDWTAGEIASRLGKDFRRRGSKNIFAYSPPDTIATVNEQVLYRDSWHHQHREMMKNGNFPPPCVYEAPWPVTNEHAAIEPDLTIGPFQTSHHQMAIDSMAVEKIRGYIANNIIPLASPGYSKITGRFYSSYDEQRYFGPLSIVKHQYNLEVRFSHDEYSGVERIRVTLIRDPDTGSFNESSPPTKSDYPERP